MADGSHTSLRERRTIVTQVLVAALTSVAFAEPVTAVDHALQRGLSLWIIATFTIFALTTVRFFIGNILHLENDELTLRGGEYKWFMDMTAIIIECIVLIFLGSQTGLATNEGAHVTFFQLLLVLYGLDIAWLMIMHAMHHSRLEPFRRDGLTKMTGRFYKRWLSLYGGWILINGVLLAWLCAFALYGHLRAPVGPRRSSPVADWRLWILVAFNVVAFVLDVFVFKYNLADDNEEIEQAGGAELAA